MSHCALPFPEINLDQVLDEHRQGAQTLVLTVNNRRARGLLGRLAAQLDADKSGAGKSVLALPEIVPLQAWIGRLIEQQAFSHETSLPAHQVDGFGSLLLWQEVIRACEAEHYLLNEAQAARLAREADQLMSNWRLTVPPLAQTPDGRRFAVWRKAYRARLAALDAQDDVIGLEQVCAGLAALKNSQDSQKNPHLFPNLQVLVLAGFTEIHPRLQQILGFFQASGVRVQCLQETSHAPPALRRLCAPSPQQEWQWAVAWARQQLQTHPEGRFAIVAPQLEGQLAFAHRLLHGGLPPRSTNIALARPLTDWPLVRAALLWLRVMADAAQGRCAPARAGAALLAGHCAAHAAEGGARARLDAQWRHKAVLRLSPQEFAQALQNQAPHLAAAWAQVQAQIQQADVGANPHIAHWVQHIKQLLTLLGFPGLGSLDSTQHQILQAFERALDALARQQVVLGRINFAQAVQTLQALLAQTGFQPQREINARLDVLGLLEAQGGRWDAVWVLGLTDDQLPSTPKPNPFIPLAVQRQAGTPRATPEREREWARASWQALQQCTPDLTLSSAAFDGECELRPSPLIAMLPVVDAGQLFSDEQDTVKTAAVMEYLIDDRAPPLVSLTASAQTTTQTTAGGVGVLEAQARNPLWAFVKYRLHARQLPAHTADVVAGQQALRGTFLHACVELFCTQIRSQQALQQLMAEHKLSDVFRQHIHHAAQRHLRDWPAALRTLECERALDVLLAWAQMESERSPYEIVALEQSQVWVRGGVRLNLKLDRVDRLRSDEILIIDYKTGMGALRPQRDWLRTPPVNLQLPLYAALLEEQDVAALVLLRLHARNVQALGLSGSDVGVSGITTLAACKSADTDWRGLLLGWRQTLEALADDYAHGRAANITRQPDDLQYCDVLPFLRLNEQGKVP